MAKMWMAARDLWFLWDDGDCEKPGEYWEEVIHDEELMVQQEELMVEIGNHVVDHQLPFTVLGQGRTSLRWKYQRILASIRLEMPSHLALQSFIHGIVSVLKDCGTERAIPRIGPVPVADMLPHFDVEDSGGPSPEQVDYAT